MAYSEEQKYWIWLASVFGLGAKRFDLLMEKSGRPQQVWEEIGPWMEPFLGKQAYSALRQARSAAYFDRLFEQLERSGAVAVTRMDPEYPPLLRTIIDPPPVLFVRGRVALRDERTLAIVGARNCTAYGTRMGRRIARDLSRMGVTVISGLARGVDGVAHRGALDAKARTVAVLGSGVDRIYPPEHARLVDEILDMDGSVISEYSLGASPQRQHFPARNRIISGMSAGVFLVEASIKSGAMSTVAFAQEQGREVLALPGQADSPMSASTHALIRDGVQLVTSANDIMADMGWEALMLRDAAQVEYSTDIQMTADERRVYNLLAGGEMDTDALVQQLEMPPQELNALLTIMELGGLVRMLPGRRVERLAEG